MVKLKEVGGDPVMNSLTEPMLFIGLGILALIISIIIYLKIYDSLYLLVERKNLRKAKYD